VFKSRRTRRVAVINGSEVAREIDDVGLTIREFARRIGVDEAQLSRVIHGGPCDPEMAFLIVRHLERLEPVR